MDMALVESLETQIEGCCNRIYGSAVRVEKELQSIAQEMRKCGCYLIQVKEQVKHGAFERWLQDHFTAGSTHQSKVRIARLWMAFYKAYPDLNEELELKDIHSIRQLLIGANVVALPQGHGKQNLIERDWFSMITNKTSEVQGIINRFLEQEPIHRWSPDRRQNVKMQLEPIVRVYEML